MTEKHEHVILVAVTVEATSRKEAHEVVMATMPTPGNVEVTSWWVAEDDRLDGSDNDSAVFCEKGYQPVAYAYLHDNGVSAAHNDPKRRPQ